jgi:hypothetical protein
LAAISHQHHKTKLAVTISIKRQKWWQKPTESQHKSGGDQQHHKTTEAAMSQDFANEPDLIRSQTHLVFRISSFQKWRRPTASQDKGGGDEPRFCRRIGSDQISNSFGISNFKFP